MCWKSNSCKIKVRSKTRKNSKKLIVITPLSSLLSSINYITQKIHLPKIFILACNPNLFPTRLISLPSSEMEVRVKLCLTNAESHHHITTFLSPSMSWPISNTTSSSKASHMNSLLSVSFFVSDSMVTMNSVLFPSKQEQFLSMVWFALNKMKRIWIQWLLMIVLLNWGSWVY